MPLRGRWGFEFVLDPETGPACGPFDSGWRKGREFLEQIRLLCAARCSATAESRRVGHLLDSESGSVGDVV